MRVYYFTEARWAIQALRRRRLKVSRFFELNDPFELLAIAQRDQHSRRRMHEWAAQLNEEEGVICFTETWQHPLMWSHYGDRHRGVCLGFDACDLEPINYKPLRLTPAPWIGGSSQPPKQLKHLLLTTKFSRWEYEKEQRLVLRLGSMTKEGGLYFKSFDDRLRLVEVIAGPRCCIGWRGALAEAVQGFSPKPRLTKSRLSFRKFRVDTQLSAGSASSGYGSDFAWKSCACENPSLHISV